MINSPLRAAILVLCIACALSTTSIGAATQSTGFPESWSVTVYGSNAETIIPGAINNEGAAVGTSQDPDGFTPVLMADGVVMKLGDGVVDGFANAINDSGAIVGVNSYPDGRTVAAIYAVGRTTELQNGRAYDIDNQGTIVGEVNSVPAYWPQGGPPLALPLLIEGRPAYVSAVNELGWMVGDAVGPHWSRIDRLADHAVLWRDGQIIDLGSIAEGNTIAVDVNDAGAIIGWTSLAGGDDAGDALPDYLSFVWQDGVMTSLPMPTGETSCYASAINELGWVVGNCGKGMQGQYGVLWVDGAIIEIDSLLGAGWSSFIATDANDSGQIIGQGMQDGQVRMFLLTPEW